MIQFHQFQLFQLCFREKRGSRKSSVLSMGRHCYGEEATQMWESKLSLCSCKQITAPLLLNPSRIDTESKSES